MKKDKQKVKLINNATSPTTPVFYINITGIQIVERRQERKVNNKIDTIDTGHIDLTDGRKWLRNLPEFFYCMCLFAFLALTVHKTQ